MAVIPENRQNITITILAIIPTVTVVLPARISNEDKPCLLRLPQWLTFANGSTSRCPRYWLNAGILTPFPCSAPKPDLCLYGKGASGRIYFIYYSWGRTKMQEQNWYNYTDFSHWKTIIPNKNSFSGTQANSIPHFSASLPTSMQ